VWELATQAAGLDDIGLLLLNHVGDFSSPSVPDFMLLREELSLLVRDTVWDDGLWLKFQRIPGVTKQGAWPLLFAAMAELHRSELSAESFEILCSHWRAVVDCVSELDSVSGGRSLFRELWPTWRLGPVRLAGVCVDTLRAGSVPISV
jgi:hypothetical protein